MNYLTNAISDALSYPARRKAQKSMKNDDREVKAIKENRATGFRSFRDQQSGDLMAIRKPKGIPMEKKVPRSMSQHDAYLQTMTKMHKKGIYSNGIGVGK